MDRKRKSVFSAYPEVCTKTTRLKAHDINYSLDESATSISCSPNSSSHLRQLVAQVISIIQNGDSSLSPDVKKAAWDLESALNQIQPAISATPGYIDSSRIFPEEAKASREHGLPLLPLIPDTSLEKAVFTHPGVNSEPRTTYDRLEILGDAYIELIATRLIWTKFRDIPSGRISQIRELLVKNETLSEFATKYGFDTRASVPSDYLKQPKRWTKTKGDIFEAYVAAVILSNPDGFSLAEKWLTHLWLPKLDRIETTECSLNAKEALAKKIMGKGVRLKYLDERPPASHEKGMQTFFIGVYLTGWGWDNEHLGSGQGLNKTIAGNNAARQALENHKLIDAIIGAKKKASGSGNI